MCVESNNNFLSCNNFDFYNRLTQMVGKKVSALELIKPSKPCQNGLSENSGEKFQDDCLSLSGSVLGRGSDFGSGLKAS